MKILNVMTIAVLLCLPKATLAQEALAPADGKAPSHCEDLLATHGLLSRAQFQCGFSQYHEQMISDARVCTKQLGEARAMEVMKFGMREFDRNENEVGRFKFCKQLLQSYPETIAE